MNLLLAILLTQSLQLQPYGPLGRTFPPGLSTKVMDVPMSISGPGFDCTGATSCLSWDGSALVETAGLTWTQNGTVPQVAANTLPTTASSGAAGPFSDANYYSNGTGSDALDSTGDRWGCVGFVPTSTTVNDVMVGNGAEGAAGYDVKVDTGSKFSFATSTPTAIFAATGNSVTVDGFNVGCFWRSGTSASAKLNLSTTATNASAGTEVSGTAYQHRVGRYEATTVPFTGKILHVMQGLGACPTPPAPFAASCEGWATYQMKRQFGLIGTRGEEITFTRATPATNSVNGVEWNVPSGVPRVSTQGLLVERATTNAALQSSTSCVANAVQAPWATTGGTLTCTSDTVAAPDGAVAMDTFTNGAGINTTAAGQAVTITSSATFTVSAWMRKAATGTTSLRGVCTAGTASTCTCGTSDGSACSAAVATTTCTGKFTAVSTTPVRGWIGVTCAAALTNPSMALVPGDSGVATGTSDFWGAQIETGLTPTSYQPTAGTAVARNADQATVPTPAGLSPSRWCVEVTGTPFGGAGWSNGVVGRGLWYAGTAGAANTAGLYVSSSTNLGLVTFDNAATSRALSYPLSSLPASGRISGAENTGVLTLRVNGASVGSPLGAGGVMESFPATLNVGNRAGLPFDGYLRDLRIFRSPLCR